MVLEGMSLLLVDTAGFGFPKDEVEEEGIRRSMEKLSGGDASLVVLDSSEPLHESDRRLLRETSGRPSLVVLNKRDLEGRTSVDEVRNLSGRRTVVEMSAKTGEGLGELRQALAGCLRELASVEDGGRSILINTRHADALRRALAGCPVSTNPFRLEAAGVGVFPHQRSPRVLWVGFHQPPDPLYHLQQRVAEAIEGQGFPGELRPFRPHLTVGRFRRSLRRDERELLASSLAGHGGRSFGGFTVSRLSLFCSTLLPSGARYDEVDGWPLGPPGDPDEVKKP